MAKNTGKQSRIGAVRGRSQVLNTRTGVWTKRADGTGRFMSGKADGGSYKGVRREKGK
jgi:hypothetical protein